MPATFSFLPPSCQLRKNVALKNIFSRISCSVYIHSLSIKEAYTLSENTSIFSAEGHGILKTLELILEKCNDSINEVIVYTDSRSVTQAINSIRKEKHPVIDSIIHMAKAMKSTGIRTSIYWIPSHVGIEGNEKADTLAGIERSSNEPSNRINNKLSVKEECIQLKKICRNISGWTVKGLCETQHSIKEKDRIIQLEQP